MDQALSAVTEMENLNTNVAKTAFTALGNFYSGAGTTVNYDDASVNEAINDVKKIINDAKDTLNGAKDGFNYGIPGFFGFSPPGALTHLEGGKAEIESSSRI